jgi:hypothetical protein
MHETKKQLAVNAYAHSQFEMKDAPFEEIAGYASSNGFMKVFQLPFTTASNFSGVLA